MNGQATGLRFKLARDLKNPTDTVPCPCGKYVSERLEPGDAANEMPTTGGLAITSIPAPR